MKLIEQLAQVVGQAGVLQDSADLGTYGSDRCRGPWSASPSVVVLPATAQQVCDVVRLVAAAKGAIVPSGGRTGLCGGATATSGEVVLSLERMRRIDPVDVAARVVRCEAGATVEAVQLAAAAHGLIYPVDFAAKGSAQIGGSIATNAGGVKVLRYGSTRAWVSGLEVVTADGELLELGGALVKDNTGYDLRQLFIGAEGTLGIVVAATMRLTRPPAGVVVAMAAVPDDAAILRLFERAQRGATLQAFEYLEHGCLQHVQSHRGRERIAVFEAPSHAYVLIEAEHGDGESEAQLRERMVELFAAAADVGEIEDAVVATTAAQARELWSLREDVSESLHRHRPHKNDVALPLAELVPFLAAWRPLVAELLPGAQALSFGHVGDGNLHLNVLPPPAQDPGAFLHACERYDDATYALVERHGGSISAEHGVGLLKRDHLHHSRSPAELAMMRAVKHALDPAALFNPGKVLG